MRATGWTRPCACGTNVTADPCDPTPRVLEHVRSEPHRSWSDRTSLVRRTVPLTVQRLAELGLLPRRAA